MRTKIIPGDRHRLSSDRTWGSCSRGLSGHLEYEQKVEQRDADLLRRLQCQVEASPHSNPYLVWELGQVAYSV